MPLCRGMDCGETGVGGWKGGGTALWKQGQEERDRGFLGAGETRKGDNT